MLYILILIRKNHAYFLFLFSNEGKGYIYEHTSPARAGNTRTHEPMSPDPYGEFFSPYLAMGNNPVSTIDPDGGRVMRSGTGAAFDVDYQGRERPVDPFDMVGPEGGYGSNLSAAYSNYSDYNEAKEFERWGGSGEDDYNRMVVTEAIINLRKIMSEYNKAQEKENAMYSNDNLIASNDNNQGLLMLLGESDPSLDKGGFINGYDNFINFMFNSAQNIGVELMGYEILDSKTNQLKYYVLPWENNTQTKSISNVYGIPGYTKSDITQQFHTHPVGVRIWGSLTDVKYSQYWKLPVNVISSQGTICRLFVPSELRFNNENADYGNIIYKKP